MLTVAYCQTVPQGRGRHGCKPTLSRVPGRCPMLTKVLHQICTQDSRNLNCGLQSRPAHWRGEHHGLVFNLSEVLGLWRDGVTNVGALRPACGGMAWRCAWDLGRGLRPLAPHGGDRRHARRGTEPHWPAPRGASPQARRQCEATSLPGCHVAPSLHIDTVLVTPGHIAAGLVPGHRHALLPRPPCPTTSLHQPSSPDIG